MKSEPPSGAVARECAFELSVAGERVPGVLWTPEHGDGPWPAVLMGHGRADDKRAFALEQPGRRWCDGHRWAAVAIDAPGHGERVAKRSPTNEVAAGEAAAREVVAGEAAAREAVAGMPPPKPDAVQARREWQAAIELLAAEDAIDPHAIAYWGFSMATALGIELIAYEPRISCAVLGLMHSNYYPNILADAALVACPVRFSLHAEDERVPLAQGLELYEAIGSADKELEVYPGEHSDFSAKEIDSGEEFLTRHLRAG